MSVQRTNEEWIRDLGSGSDNQSAAIEELSNVLLRAALYTIQRQLGNLAQFSQLEVRQLAEDCAQDAVVTLLKHLPDFRGDSKFLTWAYKFAVNIGLTMARHEQWKGVSLDDLEDQPFPKDRAFEENLNGSSPELAAMRGEVWEILSATIRDELTEKQKLVIQWMIFDEVPMDVVVQHLDTNRNAVYKLLHDARSKFKKSLQAHGIGVDESLDLYRPKR